MNLTKVLGACKSLCMSTDTVPAGEPRFDLADRMRKALRESGISAIDMADYLGVSRNTVSNWINGHARPSTAAVRLWALRTGIPYEWLRNGSLPTPLPPSPSTDRYPTRRHTTRNQLSTTIIPLNTASAVRVAA